MIGPRSGQEEGSYSSNSFATLVVLLCIWVHARASATEESTGYGCRRSTWCPGVRAFEAQGTCWPTWSNGLNTATTWDIGLLPNNGIEISRFWKRTINNYSTFWGFTHSASYTLSQFIALWLKTKHQGTNQSWSQLSFLNCVLSFSYFLLFFSHLQKWKMKGSFIQHFVSGLCLESQSNRLVTNICQSDILGQQWELLQATWWLPINLSIAFAWDSGNGRG